MRSKRTTLQLLLLIVLLGAWLRYWRLEQLPGEIFGDIADNLEHIQSVLSGDFKILYGYDGREGLLFYLVAPAAALFGNTYLTLKLVVVLIGLATIPAVYLLASEFFNEKVGLLAAFLVAVSKWPLTFSRIGFRAVLAPLFVALTFYFILKAYRRAQTLDFVWSGLFLGVGLYTYTAFRFMLLALLIIFVFFLIWRRDFIARNIIKLALFLSVFLMLAIPMMLDFSRHPAAYFAHPGPMLFEEGGGVRKDWIAVFTRNLTRQLLMFHGEGDVVFRVNPKLEPMLDVASGIFFLVGVVHLVTKFDKSKAVFFWIPFFVLQLPSILVLNVPVDIPSATRSIGIIPFVYILVASGIFLVFERIQHWTKSLQTLLLLAILTVIFALNVHAYFVKYAYGLPNHNTPIGKIIAQKIDRLPEESRIAVIGCCWGDWGQPEPKGIRYALAKPREIEFINVDATTFSCSAIQALDGNSNIFVNPNLKQQVETCWSAVNLVPTRSHYNQLIYYTIGKI